MPSNATSPHQPLPKSPSGIRGLDEVTGGGLPTGRPTLVCGGPGCGKTLFAMEFLVRGATAFGEPGVFMAFEERADELTANVASLGFDLNGLVAAGAIHLDHVRVERSEIEETGDYDLEGLFVRLDHAIKKVGAKRVVLDTIETLFSGFSNAAILRAELRRLFGWLKTRGVTTIITGERGDGTLTRQGLEEYVSDCVILLDHRVTSQVSTRRLRVVKYRGSSHGTNEYPFIIDEGGFTVLPITSAGLGHDVSNERTSTGIAGLDEMLGGEGFYRGSTVLISGTAGTGKSITCAHIVQAACARGERAMFFAFEESPGQIMRNVGSVGVDLARFVEAGLLRFDAARPTYSGMETHLARIFREVREFAPRIVVLDPLSALLSNSTPGEVAALVTRLVDMLKSLEVTAILTSLTGMADVTSLEHTDLGVSSIVDAWLLLRDIELNGERNRALYVLKARGMAHSNQIREFILSSQGVELVPAYLGPEGVLTGSARIAQLARARVADIERDRTLDRRRRAYEKRRRAIEAKIESLKAELDDEHSELEDAHVEQSARRERAVSDEQDMALSRRAGPARTAVTDRVVPLPPSR